MLAPQELSDAVALCHKHILRTFIDDTIRPECNGDFKVIMVAAFHPVPEGAEGFSDVA
jgi:hypothetical protein